MPQAMYPSRVGMPQATMPGLPRATYPGLPRATTMPSPRASDDSSCPARGFPSSCPRTKLSWETGRATLRPENNSSCGPYAQERLTDWDACPRPWDTPQQLVDLPVWQGPPIAAPMATAAPVDPWNLVASYPS